MKAIILLVVIIAQAFAQSKPGAKIRMTKQALEYGSIIGLDVVKGVIAGSKLENLQGVDDESTYTFKNVYFGETDLQHIDINMDKDIQGFVGRFTNLSTSIKIDYESWIDMLITKIQHTGSVDVDLREVSIDYKLAMDMDSKRIPKFKLLECKASIKKHNFRFSSTVVHWLYQLMVKIVPDKVRSWSEEMMCKQMTDYIENKAVDKFKELKLSSEMGKFLVDYSFLSKVDILDHSAEASHRGEIFWAQDKDKTFSFTPEDLPSEQEDDKEKMFNVWLGEHIVKTFAESAHEHDFLRTRFAEDTLSSDKHRSLLRTSCPSLTCAGSHLPKIKSSEYDWVEIEVRSNRVPDVEITEEGLRFHLHSDVIVSARKGQLLKEQFRQKVTLKLLATVVIIKDHIVPDILSYDIETSGLQGEAMPEESDALKFSHLIVREIAVPEIRRTVQDGMPLISLPNLVLQNPEIRFRNGSMHLATDVKYKQY